MQALTKNYFLIKYWSYIIQSIISYSERYVHYCRIRKCFYFCSNFGEFSVVPPKKMSGNLKFDEKNVHEAQMFTNSTSLHIFSQHNISFLNFHLLSCLGRYSSTIKISFEQINNFKRVWLLNRFLRMVWIVGKYLRVRFPCLLLSALT